MRISLNVMVAALVTVAALVACGTDPIESSESSSGPHVDTADLLLADAVDNADLPSDVKADQVFPARFLELAAEQSSVKEQGDRGTCGPFTVGAFMEHLYRSSGQKPDFDVSEQYLQWSVKEQVGENPRSAGSTLGANFQAIHEFGVPEESAWPYQENAWTGRFHRSCDGDAHMPTRCYTNGSPPSRADDAEKYFLNAPKPIATRSRDIKAELFNNRRTVPLAARFFFQSWHHPRAQLRSDSSRWKKGLVQYPNDDDKEIGLALGGGHAVLIVGWDDALEQPRLDRRGREMRDASGELVTDKGFFLFKNSWGTEDFGRENSVEPGYGWIPYSYVEEFASATVVELEPSEDGTMPQEICGDGIDNDGSGLVDCDDPVCQDDPSCAPAPADAIRVEVARDTPIPDGDPDGLRLPFEVAEPGEIAGASVAVTIRHPFRGDVSIEIEHPDGTRVALWDRSSDSDDDIWYTFQVPAFVGKPLAGEYAVIVADHAAPNEGTIESMFVDFEL